MMRRLAILLILPIILILSSCDLIIPRNNSWDIHFLSLASNYYDFSQQTRIPGSLNDQYFLDKQLAHLSSEAGLDYDAIILQCGTTENYVNNSSENWLLRKTGSETISAIEIGYAEILKQFEDAIDELASTVDPMDVLFFHYSGHGNNYTGELAIINGVGTYCLYPLEDLLDRLSTIDCYKVIILDSCYSGNAMGEDDADKRVSFASLFEEYKGKVTNWLLAAAADDEKSWDTNPGDYPCRFGRHCSLILGALGFDLDSLAVGRRDDDYLTVNMLIERLPEEAVGGHNEPQHPQSTVNIRDLILFDF